MLRLQQVNGWFSSRSWLQFLYPRAESFSCQSLRTTLRVSPKLPQHLMKDQPLLQLQRSRCRFLFEPLLLYQTESSIPPQEPHLWRKKEFWVRRTTLDPQPAMRSSSILLRLLDLRAHKQSVRVYGPRMCSTYHCDVVQQI